MEENLDEGVRMSGLLGTERDKDSLLASDICRELTRTGRLAGKIAGKMEENDDIATEDEVAQELEATEDTVTEAVGLVEAVHCTDLALFEVAERDGGRWLS